MSDAVVPKGKRPHVKQDRGVWTLQFWIPTSLSITALIISGFQSIENYKLAIMQETPRIDFTTDTEVDDPLVGVTIINNGPALAQIKQITYFIDKHPVGDADKLTDSQNLVDVTPLEFDTDDTLGVNDREWLLSESTKTKGKDEADSLDHFVDVLTNHLAVQAEVCSIFTGKCVKRCSSPGKCG